jgi:3-methyladenine DNA glycosylase AlkD
MNTSNLHRLVVDLKSFSSAERKKSNEWFFKTGKGEYGEGDVFIGVRVPDIRKVAKKYWKELSLHEIGEIISSEIHEVRLCALEILDFQYQKAPDLSSKEAIFQFYLSHIQYVNNWDLVDGSAGYIVGDFLYNHGFGNIDLLRQFAVSENLWKRRIAVVSCQYFINKGSSKEILEIAELVKQDKEDLIQKALGWMLRETFKRVGENVIRNFLEENATTLPRTTLRYTIEKMSPDERKYWLGRKQ